MAGDLFASSDRRSPVGSRHSSVVVVSMAGHIVGIAALIVISIVVPDVLPKPHAADLEWDPTANMVKLADIPLPPPPPRQRLAPPPDSVPSDAIPLEAPNGIAPEESKRRPEPPRVDLLAGALEGVGLTEAAPVAPPPPPQAKPTGPIRLRTGIDTPIKTHDMAPVYPVLARTAGAQGVVIIEATIDIDGSVVATRVLRSIPLLDAAAFDAVRQWKYTPARLNGEPVAVVVTVTVNFVLGR